MISDNYVVGDNAYLKELHNFFFEVLGMMSITHYGAIGDGRMDNYGPLQVAIDDAKRRGLNYLYVPYGRFIYTGQLDNIEGLKFVGNPHSHIVNIRTGEEIEILQFGADVETYLGNYYTKTQTDTLLSGFYTKGQADNLLGAKQDKLVAGDNIVIENDTISSIGSQNCMTAKGGQYSPTSTDITSYDTIPLSTSVSSGGFQLSNNAIVVGENTGNVLVSARINYTAVTGNTRIFAIKKGTTTIAQTSVSNTSGSSVSETVVFPPMLISVEEDDTLTLQTVATTVAGDEISGGNDAPYLTVQSAGRDGSGTGVLFTSSIAPTTWTSSTTGTDTSTNDYGEWTITTDGEPYDNSKIEKGFDGDVDTAFQVKAPSSGTEKSITLELPSGVSIRPMRIHVKAGGMKHSSGTFPTMYGYNPNTSEWVSLGTLQWRTGYSNNDVEYDITTSTYFTKFKIGNILQYMTGSAFLYEFSIDIGRVKISS